MRRECTSSSSSGSGRQSFPRGLQRKKMCLLLLGNNEVNDDGDDGEDDEDEEGQAVRLNWHNSGKFKQSNAIASRVSLLPPEEQAPNETFLFVPARIVWPTVHACPILTCMQNFLRNLTALLWNWCPCRSSTAALSSIVSNFSPRSNVMWIF